MNEHTLDERGRIFQKNLVGDASTNYMVDLEVLRVPPPMLSHGASMDHIVLKAHSSIRCSAWNIRPRMPPTVFCRATAPTLVLFFRHFRTRMLFFESIPYLVLRAPLCHYTPFEKKEKNSLRQHGGVEDKDEDEEGVCVCVFVCVCVCVFRTHTVSRSTRGAHR